MIDTEQTKGLFDGATVVPPGAKPRTERRAEMERELEKTLLEIECSIKDHERRGNTHTQSVLEQARDIIGMCARTARTPSDLKEILERATTGGWIPVEESLPDESLNSVIGWDEYRERCCFVQYYAGKWALRADREPIKITHWRPLPDRPADKTEAPDWRESMLRKFDRRE